MSEENLIKIVKNLSEFKSNFESLIYISKDVIKLREDKLTIINNTLESFNILDIVEPDEFEIEFDKVYKENPKIFEDNSVYHHKFDYLFFNSIFINFFSLFEIHLNKLGEICEKFDGNKIKIRDLKGEGIIDTTRKYFHLILKIDYASKDENLWKQIDEFKAIRNAIVHKENKLNLGKTQNLNSIKGFQKLKQHKAKIYGEQMKFEITNIDFIIEFKNTCENYLNNLTKEVIKNYRE